MKAKRITFDFDKGKILFQGLKDEMTLKEMINDMRDCRAIIDNVIDREKPRIRLAQDLS